MEKSSFTTIRAASFTVGAVTLATMGRCILFRKRVDDVGTNSITPSSVDANKEFSFGDELLSTPINKVYLFTFPRSKHIHNISPFSLKVESFLRVHNIPYEVISTFKFSPKGQIPYIRLNSKDDGFIIADSNFIIHFLSKKLGIDQMEKNMLSSQEMAVAHAFTRMIEEHTTQIGFYYRYGLNMKQFCSAVIPLDWFQNANSFTVKGWFFGKIWMHVMPRAFAQKVKHVSFGRHSDEEKWKISYQDIQSISDYLGEKTFVFGTEARWIFLRRSTYKRIVTMF